MEKNPYIEQPEQCSKLWCYWHVSSFEEGLLTIVNAGGDADTNGAIACALLGAKFGYSTIPQYYVENLHNRAMYHQKIKSFINQITDEKAWNLTTNHL